MIFNRTSLKWALVVLLFALLVVGVVVYFLLDSSEESPVGGRDLEEWLYPAPRKARGAIVGNGGPCAQIGMRILKKYENAVDALVATMLCDGVTSMEHMGIGGGFLATLYIKSQNKVVTLNAREMAPSAATANMFVANKTLSLKGGLAIAVPGEIRGYYELHQKYGGPAKWSELFEETIALCEEGIPVGSHLNRAIRLEKNLIMNMPDLRELLINEEGELPKFGDKIKLPKMANTLKTIAKEGPDALYNGSLTAGLVKDIKEYGGIITEEDLASYRAIWDEPYSAKLSTGDTVYSVPPPGSGAILTLILKLLDRELPSNADEPFTTFTITEAFKFAYGIRSMLGDPHFVNDTELLEQLQNVTYVNSIKKKLHVEKTSNDVNYYGSHYIEDHGTANIVVFAPNGDAVSATSTVNTRFGSGVVSKSTGIILNNEMDDFSTPGLVNFFGVSPSPENFIAPRKRPMSSMAPSIVLNKNGEPRLIVGAAGGTKITTSVALSIIRNVWFNKSITDAVKEPRFHHQLMPMEFNYEPQFNKTIVAEMKKRGHVVTEGSYYGSCVTAISINGDILGASGDMRRPGNTSYLVS